MPVFIQLNLTLPLVRNVIRSAAGFVTGRLQNTIRLKTPLFFLRYSPSTFQVRKTSAKLIERSSINIFTTVSIVVVVLALIYFLFKKLIKFLPKGKEEKTILDVDKIRAAEERAQAAEKRAQLAEERLLQVSGLKLDAEKRAQAAEERAKAAEKHAKVSAILLQDAGSEENMKELLRIAEERVMAAERRAMIAEERAEEAEAQVLANEFLLMYKK
ncbi:hypothetical protein [Candidatus Similichlamydia epinepheli]|uniref:hypothetical protein n=1 Tax=Candidatus Similichlamydia epinepheli TaxID=1903953 RepID=UPI000D3C0C9D|nr:hypothetical protein [Candidatus Similichlamydia epinepheli]